MGPIAQYSTITARTDDFNSFGNFVNRALKFVASQYESTIPDSGDEPGPYSPNDENDADFNDACQSDHSKKDRKRLYSSGVDTS